MIQEIKFYVELVGRPRAQDEVGPLRAGLERRGQDLETDLMRRFALG